MNWPRARSSCCSSISSGRVTSSSRASRSAAGSPRPSASSRFCSADRCWASRRPTEPKSSRARRPSVSSRMLPGCGSAWNTPPSVIWYTMLRSSARVSSARSSPRSSISGPAFAQANPVQPFDDEHVLGAQLLIHAGQHHRDAAARRPAAGPARWRPRRPCCVPPPGSRAPPAWRRRTRGPRRPADRTRPAGAALKLGRQAQQDVQVLFDGGADPGALDLHRHLGVRAVAAAQPGLVDLGDRCGRGRLGPQLGENLPRRYPE